MNELSIKVFNLLWNSHKTFVNDQYPHYILVINSHSNSVYGMTHMHISKYEYTKSKYIFNIENDGIKIILTKQPKELLDRLILELS